MQWNMFEKKKDFFFYFSHKFTEELHFPTENTKKKTNQNTLAWRTKKAIKDNEW